RWQTKLLALAAEQGIDLHAADFVKVPEVAKRPAGPPVAEWWGELDIGEGTACYVLNDGRRVLSRTGATCVLAGKKGGGQLEKYIAAGELPNYMPADLQEKMIDFTIPEVVNKTVRGIEAETFVEICRGYVRAMEQDKLGTTAQKEMAIKAAIFL